MKSRAFIAIEVFFLIIGIVFVISAASGFLVTDRNLLFLVLGIVISIGACIRIIMGIRSLRMENRGRS